MSTLRTAEAFGLVLVEALACGTPVGDSGNRGTPEVVARPEITRNFRGYGEPLERRGG